MSMAARVNAAKVTAARELRSTVYGFGIYVVLAFIFVVVSYFGIHNTLGNIAQDGAVSSSNPIGVPFFVSVGFAAAYLGLCSAISISRERDQGTLEVLFYGPVDSVSYVAGKYMQQIMAFLLVLAFSVINFVAISMVTHLAFNERFIWILVLSIFLNSCMVSFGIFLSALTRRMIISIILFIGLVLFFIAFWMAYSYVISLSATDLNTLMVYVRIALDKSNAVIQWISPIAYYQRGAEAVGIGSLNGFLTSVIASIIYSGVLLWAAVALFNKKGVRR